MQELSVNTSLPIEPLEYSLILDYIIWKQKDVYAVCPGAGGYDAMVVLTRKENSLKVKDLIESISYS